VPFLHHASPMRAISMLLAVGVASAGCVAPQADEGDADDADGKADSSTHHFTEVDGGHTSSSFRRYIHNALDELAAAHTQLANMTLSSIEAGRVHIDELVDLTCPDFVRVLHDSPDLPYTVADYPHLHDHPSKVADAITAELDGYMWSNRIYVGRGQRAHHLASTLVHEVNHVVNASEQHYYDDLPSSEFREEYRAFYVEGQFDPDMFAGVDLADYVITEYELDRSKIHAALLANPLTPTLLPTLAAWRARDVTADVETETCP
jgi:hypothetical protein